jgi:SAM-dependent methyltransferase
MGYMSGKVLSSEPEWTTVAVEPARRYTVSGCLAFHPDEKQQAAVVLFEGLLRRLSAEDAAVMGLSYSKVGVYRYVPTTPSGEFSIGFSSPASVDSLRVGVRTWDNRFPVGAKTSLSVGSREGGVVDNGTDGRKTPISLYLTFDVEDNKNEGGTRITGKGVGENTGLSFILQELKKRSLRGVFFVNAYEHTLNDGLIDNVTKEIHSDGHEIALHTHESETVDIYCRRLTSYSLKEKVRILRYGMEHIKSQIGVSPISYRSGGYLFDEDMWAALEESGIKVDSTLWFGHPANGDIKYRTVNEPCYYNNILEFPISVAGQERRPFVKLDINTLEADIIEVFKRFACTRTTTMTFMAHSFSFLRHTTDPKSALMPTRYAGNRYIYGENVKLKRIFIELLDYVVDHPETYRVRTFRDSFSDYPPGLAENPALGHIPYIRTREYQVAGTGGDGSADTCRHFCPCCQNPVPEFLPYRSRKGALCPICKSLERTRFTAAILQKRYHVKEMQGNVLHIGPAAVMEDRLKALPGLNYISGDLFERAMVTMNVEKLPFQSDTFDLAIAIAVFMHVLDDDAGFAELRRVVKPGGNLLLWLGPCAQEETRDHYDRAQYSRMRPLVEEYPEDLHAGGVVEKDDGYLYYNPRAVTRVYGKDVRGKLERLGLSVQSIKPADVLEDPACIGVNRGDVIFECTKELRR